jgi:hypothetical protein
MPKGPKGVTLASRGEAPAPLRPPDHGRGSRDFLLAIHTALPEATARARDHGQETKHEIDRNDVADLIQLLSSFGVCLPFDGVAKTAPRRETSAGTAVSSQCPFPA